MDRDDDEIVVDNETYKRVFKLTGGYKMIAMVLITQLFGQIVGKWMDYIQIEWSFEDKEQQFNNLGKFLYTTFFAVIITQIVEFTR